MAGTKEKPMKPTFHRDNTVTFWSVYEQRWIRVAAQRISDEELAGMNFDERARVIRMAKKAVR